jgi:hypothetical protein
VPTCPSGNGYLLNNIAILRKSHENEVSGSCYLLSIIAISPSGSCYLLGNIAISLFALCWVPSCSPWGPLCLLLVVCGVSLRRLLCALGSPWGPPLDTSGLRERPLSSLGCTFGAQGVPRRALGTPLCDHIPPKPQNNKTISSFQGRRQCFAHQSAAPRLEVAGRAKQL